MLGLEKSSGKTDRNFLGKVEKSSGEDTQLRAKNKEIDEVAAKEDIR